MNLKPGCGCLVVILGLLNLMLAVIAIRNLVVGNVDSGLNAILHIAALGGSSAVCLLVGFPAVRRRRGRQVDEAGDEGVSAGYGESAQREDEGVEVEEESDN